MYFMGLGRVDAKTTWSKNGKEKTILELQEYLIEILKMTKRQVPDQAVHIRLGWEHAAMGGLRWDFEDTLTEESVFWGAGVSQRRDRN